MSANRLFMTAIAVILSAGPVCAEPPGPSPSSKAPCTAAPDPGFNFATPPFPLPADFWCLSRPDRLRYLQAKLTEADLFAQISQKLQVMQKGDGHAPTAPAQLAQAQPTVVVQSPEQKPAQDASTTPPDVAIQRIHFRDGKLVAEALIPNQGRRQLRTGDGLSGGWSVVDITTDKVKIGRDDKQTELPAAGGAIPASLLAPSVASRVLDGLPLDQPGPAALTGTANNRQFR